MEEGRFRAFLEENFTYDSNSDSKYLSHRDYSSLLPNVSQMQFIFGERCGSFLSCSSLEYCLTRFRQ